MRQLSVSAASWLISIGFWPLRFFGASYRRGYLTIVPVCDCGADVYLGPRSHQCVAKSCSLAVIQQRDPDRRSRSTLGVRWHSSHARVSFNSLFGGGHPKIETAGSEVWEKHGGAMRRRHAPSIVLAVPRLTVNNRRPRHLRGHVE